MGFESGSFNNNEEITSKTEKIEEEYIGTSEEYNYLKHASRYTWERLQEAKNKKEVNSEEVNKLQTLLDDLNTQQEKSWAKQQEKLVALNPQEREEYQNLKSKIYDLWREELIERDRTHQIDANSNRTKDIYELESKKRELEQKYNL